MTGELLRSTAYFGERQRSGDRFTADALLDLYTAAPVVASVVIRGIAGFGPRHDLRSDVTLSGSEDPPLAVTAVGPAETIRRLASETARLLPRGLVTLESVRSADAPLPATPSVTLTAYVPRGRRVSGAPAYVAVGDVFRRHRFRAAIAYLGVDGIAGGRRRRAVFFGRNLDVPAVVVGTGPTDRAVAAVDDLRSMSAVQLLTVETATTRTPPVAPLPDPEVRRKLTVQTCATTRYDGVPVHRALVDRLREVHRTAGVTVLRGVWGFDGDAATLTDSVLRVGRRVPVTTIAVDTPERIATSLAVVDALTAGRAVVTVGPVADAVSVDRDTM
ncbi:DUF190 domain-containing protein [Mycolicibacterium litorale]|uniref:DUF190 domain-containing protein n=1 Tax=Mycolicibacterium litorale TaxID=758802 RepID=UPI0039A16830